MHVQKPESQWHRQPDIMEQMLAGILTFDKALMEPLDCYQMLRKSLPTLKPWYPHTYSIESAHTGPV